MRWSVRRGEDYLCHLGDQCEYLLVTNYLRLSLHPTLCTLHPTPYTLCFKPQILNLETYSSSPKS
jgi:hypothetical protein